jgi:multicomponent Na+:H+ antiporter subunit F
MNSSLFFNGITVFLLASCVLGIIRIVIGPTTVDRLTALNLVASEVLVLLVITAIRTGAPVYLDVAMVYAVFGFVGILALTRYLSGKVSGEEYPEEGPPGEELR